MKTVIPVILQPSTKDYFWAGAVLDGIKTAATRYNCEWQILDPNCFEQLSKFKGLPVIISGHSADWLLNTADSVSFKGLTPIITNGSIPSLSKSRFSGVCFDLRSGMEETIECCINDNRNHIALLGVQKNSAADREKISAFCEIAERNNLSAEFIYYIENSMEQTFENFVSELFDHDINAVICANDTVAFFLMEKLKSNGIKVPNDVFVLGMGNFTINRILDKPLTSLGFDYAELGAQAVRLWRYFFRDGAEANITVSVSCRLIHRETSVNCAKEQPLKPETTIENNTTTNSFFEEPPVNAFLKFEAMLCDFDELDYKLLKLIAKGFSDEDMAETVGLTPRAIRYRVSKMVKKADVGNRIGLSRIMNQYNIFNEVK